MSRFSIPWLIVSLIYLIVELWINPSGEYTINDDWSYCKAIENYENTGNLIFSKYIAVPFILQFYIGVLISKLFGFSFFILRVPSIIALIISGIFLDKTLKEFSLSFKSRLFSILILFFNPLIFSLSSTFMPEMFTICFLTIAIWSIIKLKQSKFELKYYIILILSSILLTFTRQTGLLIPLSFGFVSILVEPKNIKSYFVAILPFLISFSLLKTYELIMIYNNTLPLNFNLQLNNILKYFKGKPTNSLIVVSLFIVTSFTTLGCFLLPIIIPKTKFIFKLIINNKIYLSIVLLFNIAILLKVLFTVWYTPFVGNMFWSKGIGPVIINGFNSDKWIFIQGYSKYFYAFLSLLGGVSFSFLMVYVTDQILTDFKSLKNQLRLISLLITFGYIFLVSLNYANDRYMLFLIPLLIPITLSKNDKIINPTSLFLLTLLSGYTILCTKDYFAFHNARGKAINHLINDLKIEPKNIDGGFEFNGYYTSELSQYNSNHNTRWWWVYNDDYIISVRSKIKGYSKINEYPLTSNYISYPFNKINVFKRN